MTVMSTFTTLYLPSDGRSLRPIPCFPPMHHCLILLLFCILLTRLADDHSLSPCSYMLLVVLTSTHHLLYVLDAHSLLYCIPLANRIFLISFQRVLDILLRRASLVTTILLCREIQDILVVLAFPKQCLYRAWLQNTLYVCSCDLVLAPARI
ncbi:hypothetical protein BJV74DRAFT_11333 [Russula compacta]|nr:hypothetical protein BJV74DRAFT_11333 [Russula compacta]